MPQYFIQRFNCPGCKSDSFKEIFRLPYTNTYLENYLKNFYNSQGKIELEYLSDAEYVLQKCDECAMIFQEFIPNDFLMGKLYEEWINPSFVKEESLHHSISYYEQKANEIIDAIKFFNKPPNNLKFLDFGMGWAEWCKLSKAMGVDTYGMELSKDRIDNAKSHQIKIVDWDELINYKFDYINTEQVIEHLAEPIETIEYLMKSLKPGGLFKISVPNGSTAERNLKLLDWNQPRDSEYSLHVVTPLEHINVFMVESIIKMADKCGLDPIYTVRNVAFDHTISWTQFLKHKLGPFYRKIKRSKLDDSSIFFVKR